MTPAIERSGPVEQTLREVLSTQLGRSVLYVDRRPCPYASSHRIDEIDLRFDDGSSLGLVMKDGGLSADARQLRPELLHGPGREIRAYQRLLPLAPAGAAACYGTVSEEPGSQWLLLERVDGFELCHVGAFRAWARTAEWIGGFHRAFESSQAHQLAADAGLLVYDDQFYRRWLERALRFSADASEARRVLEQIHGAYDIAVRRLCRLPRTIIHGELYPSNVLVVDSPIAPRICPVDWEMAALGPGLMDIAALSTGWNDAERHALLVTYHRVLSAGAPLTAHTTQNLLFDLDCCRLHLAIRMLGWSGHWSPPPQHAFDWLGEAARTAERLQR